METKLWMYITRYSIPYMHVASHVDTNESPGKFGLAESPLQLDQLYNIIKYFSIVTFSSYSLVFRIFFPIFSYIFPSKAVHYFADGGITRICKSWSGSSKIFLKFDTTKWVQVLFEIEMIWQFKKIELYQKGIYYASEEDWMRHCISLACIT